MASVTLKNISKKFGGVAAVENVSLTVSEGEFVALVGPSGCGKSTTLRMIAGLEGSTEGEIWIGDRLANDIHAADRDVAMVFQNYALYPHMSVFNNIAYGLRRRGYPSREIEARVNEAANLLQLGGLLQRRPAQLSGGQRQRVALGRAIVRRPAALLMDEPLSNLDTQLRAGTRAELLRLHQRLQTTTIYVTHDQVEAMTLADIIVVMRDGRIEQAGSPLDVFEKPVNTFVATFIGSPPMNLLPAVVKHAGGRNLAMGAGFTFPLGKLRQTHEGRSVKIGIRPRDFSPSKAVGGLQGTIQLIEPTGDECYVHVAAGGVRFLVSIPGRPQFHVGDTVGFMTKKGSTHVFDAITDTRLI